MADTRVDIYQAIRVSLGSAAEVDFAQQAAGLVEVLGYRSDRTLPQQSGAVDDFLEQFPAEHPDTKSESAFREAAASIHVLFQYTDEEISGADGNLTLFRDNEFQTGNVRSFLFTAVELRSDSYARGRYAAFTREINKRFPGIPAVVLFRTASGRVTLAFVHVRPNKRNPERNVIGSVSLIREIVAAEPHRAHLDILGELRLEERLRWMTQHGQPRNFDGLLAAWLDALDTEELNRRFYKDLFCWFQRAVIAARFPTDQLRTLSAEEHVIRLITRLLFVWFIKEKRLIAEELFVEPQVAELLRDYNPGGDSYYRAVLQNLFFATLNTEIGEREFSRRSSTTHRVFSRYRYESEIADPDALLALFAKTPFINGGLFDCLDSEEAGRDGGYRIDCFTDNVIRKGADEYEMLSIPNWLFFGNEGLIDLFNHYKFTVEENTPAEQEVALDPELLGKVFENLLAAYNPETRETARKQTGSYYTPRPVVDYMVEEVLVASLVGKVDPASADTDWWEDRLRYLLDYNDAFEDAAELFAADESDGVVRAIAGLKALDPAVGSGAFPMSVLNKLTLALRRLDPDNERWAELQKDLARRRAGDAFDTADQQERDAELTEISATFERYHDSDFGRKLYLIQNSIYGVDIQAVATQIAKLRFFISLAIEQEPTHDRQDNYGIKPLPNLETRFVAANALLGLERPVQLSLGQTSVVNELNQKLNDNRERHFHATTRRQKRRCRDEDNRLRQELAAVLREADFPAADAAKISSWDPFDLNASADWFDPAYMFGIECGFDVVIGNPPYVVTKDRRLRQLYKEGVYGRMNTYGLFIQRGLQLTREEGQLTYINPRTLLTDRYFTNLRKVIRQNAELRGLVLISDRRNTFESVLQECIIPHLTRRSKAPEAYSVHIRSIVRPDDLLTSESRISIDSKRVLLSDLHDHAFLIGTSDFDYDVFGRMVNGGVTLESFGLKAATGKIQFDKYREYAQPTKANNACRLIWAENIQRYAVRDTRVRVGKEWLSEAITSEVVPNITSMGIVTQRTTATEQPRRIIATLVTSEQYCAQHAYSENGTNFISLDTNEAPYFFLAVINSSLMEFVFRMLNSNVHVSAGELNALPLPPMVENEAVLQIDAICRQLVELGGVDCQNHDRLRALGYEYRLDVLIGALYGLTEEEVRRVHEQLTPYEAVYALA